MKGGQTMGSRHSRPGAGVRLVVGGEGGLACSGGSQGNTRRPESRPRSGGFRGAAGLLSGALLLAGCGVAYPRYQPQGVAPVILEGEFGAQYPIPPGGGGTYSALTLAVTRVGVRDPQPEARLEHGALTVTLHLDNQTPHQVELSPHRFLLERPGMSSLVPAEVHVLAEAPSAAPRRLLPPEKWSVDARTAGTAEVLFLTADKYELDQMKRFTVRWSYAWQGQTYAGSTTFERYEPRREEDSRVRFGLGVGVGIYR